KRGCRRPSLKIVLGEADDPSDLPQEPAIDPRPLVYEIDGRAAPECGEEPPESIVRGLTREEPIHEVGGLGHVHPRRRLPEKALALDLERAERLLQGRLERAVDGHDLTGRLHLRAERAVRGRELVEGPPWDLH